MAKAKALEATSDAKSELRSMVFSCHPVGVVLQTVHADICCKAIK